jgi:aryl-alcohol dehydrogenase-like predicted oxidoreductase
LFRFSQVTNNGISLVQTFSLGKPAAIVTLSIGKGKLSFEPDLRFSLKEKPWIVPLPGTTKLHRLTENNEAAFIQLTVEEFQEIEDASAHIKL